MAPTPPSSRQGSLPLATPRNESIVEGEVAHVTYENDGTGFRVLKVDVPGRGQQTIVGVFPKAPPGTHVRATGSYVTDSRHGEQFKATTLLTLAPSTLEGIRRYLGSGLVPGIGKAYATRIVEVFKDETLTVLDNHPERLREVPGLGARRVQSVVKAWAEHRDIGAIMVFLQSHGASPALATRIFKRFGNKAIKIVSESPYRLALDVWGVGFKTADTIARSVGVGADSPERGQAGVLQSLHDAAGSGHVYAPRADLVARTTALLECGEVRVEEAIDALLQKGRVYCDKLDDGIEAVYTPELRDAELRVAERLGLLLRESEPLDKVEHAVAEFEKLSGLELADEQRQAIVRAATHKVLVITGGPGVGKTTIVRALLALFDASRLSVQLAAPTGRAAKRMAEATGREASTIHRLLEFDPQGNAFRKNHYEPLESDAVIIDESSMVAIELADALLQAIPNHARVVFVGDVDQLPSVGPGSVLRDIISSECVPTVRLNHIFRQAEGSSIVVNAHRIHNGEAPVGATTKGEQFYVIDRRSPEQTAELIRELVSTRVPRGFGLDPVRDLLVLTPMQRGNAGAIALNHMLQEALNPSGPSVQRGNRTLRRGDKVMQLRNNYDKEVFNGDIGFIDEVDREERQITVKFDGRPVSYTESELDDLTLAYATSIHKSQGSEYPAVIVPILTQHFVMLSRNLIYTAVTRGKQLVILIADPRALSIALGETRKEERCTYLAQRIRDRVERS